jgi:hypothetical protein
MLQRQNKYPNDIAKTAAMVTLPRTRKLVN